MNGTSKTFLNKNLAEKKLKQNYLLGSTTLNPKLFNRISTTEKACWKNIMTESKSKHLLAEESLVPFARHSTTYYNQAPQTTPLIDFAKFLVSLGHRDPMLLSLFMIALSSTYTKMTGE